MKIFFFRGEDCNGLEMRNISRLFEERQWNIHDWHIVHSLRCELIYKLYPKQQMRNSAFYVFDYSFAATWFGEISILS